MARVQERKGFAALIYERRRELRLTQAEVAQRLGVHTNYVGYLEKGARQPSARTLAAMCQVLDLDRRRVLAQLRPEFRDVTIGSEEGLDGRPYPRALRTLRRDRRTRSRLGITEEDIRRLSVLGLFGTVTCKDDYVRFLQLMRDVTR